MTVQEQAFRAYYSRLSDAELLKIHANKRSFIPIAQEALAAELRRRRLQIPDANPGEKAEAKLGK
jgi:hypothetical protein